ncbi:DUF502 domain-containing protein [Pseudazoarcus pumilus]|uniref:DUF502 domain-containing protein n=1 Tax=Pseudazoarcus pumilus TaxID=2067960 RepID=A0A2I6S9A2_9RHOO|nr:DUF502 domain-containing protein [Pseudazoarcus pumilus]AUN95840.1 hypothetical protein C0099_13420 [Pseudazoarcus pumilus]
MGVITRNILTGLITILPVTLTIYLLWWLVVSAENLLGRRLLAVLPDGIYQPGLGVAIGLVLCFVVGLLMHTYVMQRLVEYGETLFQKLPIVRSIYPTIRDFFEYFSPMRKKDFRQVVAVKLPETGLEVVGLVTQTDRNRMPRNFGDEGSVLVYLPMSYMIGGYTAVVPRANVRELDISMDEAMRFILTAGVTGVGNQRKKVSRPEAVKTASEQSKA